MIDKSQLTAKREESTRDVELPTLGGSVRVRGLTRAEALRVQGKQMDALEAERKLLHLAMVEPLMSEEDVRQWQHVAPAGELQPIQDAILTMSGLTADAVKEAVKSFRD
jgi:hypothetical protein